MPRGFSGRYNDFDSYSDRGESHRKQRHRKEWNNNPRRDRRNEERELPRSPAREPVAPEVPIVRAARSWGTVQWFDAAKGYGKIAADDGGPPVFLHISQWADRHNGGLFFAGDRVEFELEQGPRGPRAKRVRKLGPIVDTASITSTQEG